MTETMVPQYFVAFCETVPMSIRKNMSIHQLRWFWDARKQIVAEAEELAETRAAAYRDGLEAATNLCDEMAEEHAQWAEQKHVLREAGLRIRALKEQPL